MPSLFVLLMEYALLWCRHFGKSTPFPRAHARILLGYAWLSVIWFVGRNLIGV